MELKRQYFLPRSTVGRYNLCFRPRFISPTRVGVGFSYADYGETVETTEDAAKNIHAFVFVT